MTIRYLKTISLFCAIGTMALSTTLSAQQNGPLLTTQPQEDQTSVLSEHSESCIAKLTKVVELNPDQVSNIHDVYQKREVEQRATWHKFAQAQLAAISIEAEMYATMEARMSDSQKQTFTTARTSPRTEAAEEKISLKTLAKTWEKFGRKDKSLDENAAQFSPKVGDGLEKQAQTATKRSLSPSESFVRASIIAPMEQAVVSLGLSSEESAKCKSACRVFHTKLNTAWDEIHSLRGELVTQQANTIKAVTKVLTKDQISKLEKHRALASKADASDSTLDR